jgi:hypothetical protein
MYTRTENWENTAILLSGPTLWWRGVKDCWGNPYCNDNKSSHTPPLAGTGNNDGEWLDLAAKADCVSGLQTGTETRSGETRRLPRTLDFGAKAENP